MRAMFPLIALAVLACSGDSTGPSNNTGVSIVVTPGVAYMGHPWTASVTNSNSATANVRALDCGTQVQKQEGDNWISYLPTGSICSFIGILAGESQTFTVNLPTNAGAGTYRVVSAVKDANGNEVTIYSDGFAVIIAPLCTQFTPPGQICTPQ